MKPAGATIESKPQPKPVPDSTPPQSSLASPEAAAAQQSQIQAQLQAAIEQIKQQNLQDKPGSAKFAGAIISIFGAVIVYLGVWLGLTFPSWGWAVGILLILAGGYYGLGGIPYVFGLWSLVNCPRCGKSGATQFRNRKHKCSKCGVFVFP